ncbi:MAG TPA: NPCBM/NEW2 domain-containing protein [Verrucomicrobiae bacterium]|nr:NPCBM/NEW2 domain-containing protein [Verrucomicrobiae bacterium]
MRGEAGLHTTFQGSAYGVVFVIKADGKQVFQSAVIHGSEHPRYDLNLAGVKALELVVEKAQRQNGGNWGLWLDPTLFR